MMRRALEMSKGEQPNGMMQQISQTENQTDSKYEEIIQLALEYGFDSEQAVQAISVVGTKNPDNVLNYLMNLYGYMQGYSSSF